jgi:hypothetical protein
MMLAERIPEHLSWQRPGVTSVFQQHLPVDDGMRLLCTTKIPVSGYFPLNMSRILLAPALPMHRGEKIA